LLRGTAVNKQSIEQGRRQALNDLEDPWALLGFPDSIRDAIVESSQAILSAEQWFGIMQRGYADEEEAIRAAARTGIHVDDLDALFRSSNPRIGLANAQEADRRGFILEETGKVNPYTNEGLGRQREKTIGQKLRFNVPSLIDLRDAWLRGWYTNEQYDLALQAAGVGDKVHEEIRARVGERQAFTGPDDHTRAYHAANSWIIATPTDMVQFAVKEAFDEEVVRTFGHDAEFPGDATGPMSNSITSQFRPIAPKMANARSQGEFFRAMHESIGIPEAIMRFQWRQHWRLPAPGQVFDMFFREVVDDNVVEQYLKAQDFAPFWRERLLAIQRPLIPRRPLSQALRNGVIDAEEAERRLKMLGFSDEDSAILSETDVRRAFFRQRDRTKERILSAFRADEISQQESAGLLQRAGFSQDVINFELTDSVVAKRADAALVEARTIAAEADEAKDLTKSEILSAFRSSVIDREAARASLVRVGFSAANAELLIEREQLSRLVSDRRRIMNLIRDRFFAAAIDAGTVREELGNAGLSSGEINRLVTTWDTERRMTRQLEAVRDKGPTKAELKRWAKAGIIDEPTFRAELERGGYTDLVVNATIAEVIASE